MKRKSDFTSGIFVLSRTARRAVNCWDESSLYDPAKPVPKAGACATDLDPVDAVAISPMRRFLERGGGWVAGQFLLFGALAVLALRYPGTGPAAWRASGVGVLIAAAAIAIAGAKALGKNLTPFPKPVAHAELVEHGIYSEIRHPLYTAVILARFGWSLVWLSWPAAVVAAGLIPFFHAKSRREEVFLRQKFPGIANTRLGPTGLSPGSTDSRS